MTGRAPTPDVLEAALRPTADAMGASLRTGGSRLRPVVELVGPRWIVTMEGVWMEQGWLTVLRAPFRSRGGPRFAVRSQRMFDDFWKMLGFLQDVELGDGAFDWRFVVKGSDPDATRSVLDEEIRRRLMALAPVDLRVDGPPPSGRSPELGPTVEEVRFREAGHIEDPARVVGLFELTLELLERLAPAGPGIADDPEALMARLEGPRRRTASPWEPDLYWDGRLAVGVAARRLGELGVADAAPALIDLLEDSSDELVATAVEALGRIGAPEAVPPLVERLGSRMRQAGGEALSVHAARALETLGEAATVAAFAAALRGEPRALLGLTGEVRDAVVRALMRIVDSDELEPRPHAARALGALGASEALALLRQKSTALGMRTRLTEAAREAVAEIESRAGLPRPAGPVPERPDTHPRPAGSPDPDADTLPRSSRSPEGEG